MHCPSKQVPGPDLNLSAATLSKRRLCTLAPAPCLIAFSLLALANRSLAQQPSDPSPQSQSVVLQNVALPSAPEPQPPATVPAISGAVSGTITDSDGAAIVGAKVMLTPEGADPKDARVAVTAEDGRFSFTNVSPGPFKVSIAASGFTVQQSSGELAENQSFELPPIALRAASSTNVNVTATQTEIAQAQVKEEEKQRVIGIFPNFYVSYVSDPVPLNPKQKYSLALMTLIDPVSFVLNGVTAGSQQAANQYAWGQGALAFGKRFAADYGTTLTGTLIGSAALPILFKQDPRYFYKGTGTIASRFNYAVANAVICKGDNHHWQPNYSSILGGLAASGISNFYYPAVNRTGARLTFEGAAIGTGISAVSNLIQEFIVRRLTPHIPPRGPAVQ